MLALGSLLMLQSCGPKDAEIATNAKAKIDAISQGLTVDVKDGVVTLSGEVMDDAAKTAVAAALTGMKGVKSVVNNTTVKPPPPPPVVINPDDVLKKSIDSIYAAKGIKGITVTAVNGEVTLTGDVKKADLMKVMQAANEAKPGKVVNKLNIQR
jgi:hyperosmotically inducible periplasmic protein